MPEQSGWCQAVGFTRLWCPQPGNGFPGGGLLGSVREVTYSQIAATMQAFGLSAQGEALGILAFPRWVQGWLSSMTGSGTKTDWKVRPTDRPQVRRTLLALMG
ncbi:MAG: hypothetical protein D6755_07030 [Anaerolineae bacterium]|nr:MAG: hypothetical protein D6755_07030 [Anaerolineae bacterium]